MSYRVIPNKQRIDKKLRDNPQVFNADERAYISEAMGIQDKLMEAISSFLSTCLQCRGGDFCLRCELLIQKRDAALGKNKARINAAKKLQPAIEDEDEESVEHYQQASEAYSS